MSEVDYFAAQEEDQGSRYPEFTGGSTDSLGNLITVPQTTNVGEDVGENLSYDELEESDIDEATVDVTDEDSAITDLQENTDLSSLGETGTTSTWLTDLGNAGASAAASYVGSAIGSMILPGIGTVLGTVLGSLVGDLFGGGTKHAAGATQVLYDTDTGLLSTGTTGAKWLDADTLAEYTDTAVSAINDILTENNLQVSTPDDYTGTNNIITSLGAGEYFTGDVTSASDLWSYLVDNDWISSAVPEPEATEVQASQSSSASDVTDSTGTEATNSISNQYLS